MICPICSGRGEIEPRRPSEREFQVKMAKRLRAQNLTYREIAKLMNYKSPMSVYKLLSE